MNNRYIINTAIKCSDGKVHMLSYDMINYDETETFIPQLCNMFKYIEENFPDTHFCIKKGSILQDDDIKDQSETLYGSMDELIEFTRSNLNKSTENEL